MIVGAGEKSRGRVRGGEKGRGGEKAVSVVGKAVVVVKKDAMFLDWASGHRVRASAKDCDRRESI